MIAKSVTMSSNFSSAALLTGPCGLQCVLTQLDLDGARHAVVAGRRSARAAAQLGALFGQRAAEIGRLAVARGQVSLQLSQLPSYRLQLALQLILPVTPALPQLMPDGRKLSIAKWHRVESQRELVLHMFLQKMKLSFGLRSCYCPAHAVVCCCT